MQGKILMKKTNSLLILIILLFTACGGSSSSPKKVKEEIEDETQINFKRKTLYSFNLNFVDQRQRYDLREVDGVDGRLNYKYFNFDSDIYEVDSKEQALFVNGKRSALADASYSLEENGRVVKATVDGQKMFSLTLLEENEIKSEKLIEYGSNIAIEGKVYTSRLTYLSNLHKVKDLLNDSAYDNLEVFVNAYKNKTFIGSDFNGLVFGDNNNIRERIENNVSDAGTYRIEKIDNKEILFIIPNNTKRYGKNSCYILDFSRVWKAECHLKDSNETIKFYSKDVYDDVLKYMQTNFTDIEIAI